MEVNQQLVAWEKETGDAYFVDIITGAKEGRYGSFDAETGILTPIAPDEPASSTKCFPGGNWAGFPPCQRSPICSYQNEHLGECDKTRHVTFQMCGVCGQPKNDWKLGKACAGGHYAAICQDCVCEKCEAKQE